MAGTNKMEEMMEQMKPVYTEVFGTNEGEAFDDIAVTKTEQGEQGTIVGIEIRSGYIVDAIGVIYKENGKAALHGNAAGGSSCKIIFDEKDDLKSITGCYGVRYGSTGDISNLRIETRNGKKYGPFGDGRNEKQFRIEIPEGNTLAGFFGNTNAKRGEMALTKLGIIYRKEAGTNLLGDFLKEELGTADDGENAFSGLFSGM